MSHLILSGAAIDTLHKLYKFGDQEDGDLPSKSGMIELIGEGLATKDYHASKPNSATEYGLYVYANKLYQHKAQ